MSHEQLQNELNYTMSVKLIQKMLDKGLINRRAPQNRLVEP